MSLTNIEITVSIRYLRICKTHPRYVNLLLLMCPICFSYSLADRAWHQLRHRGQDQVIVLTGESGSGKTEAGKLVMQYLAAVTGHSKLCQDIKYQLLQSNPVLEGLGNAKTLHNDNSSRFVSDTLQRQMVNFKIFFSG